MRHVRILSYMLSFEVQLREALARSPMTCYRIAKMTGITAASLSYFLNSRRSLSLDAASKLADVLGFELVQRDRKER